MSDLMNAHLLATRIFDNAEPVVREQILADIEPLVVERVKRSVDEEVQERGVEVSTRLREIEEEEEHHEGTPRDHRALTIRSYRRY